MVKPFLGRLDLGWCDRCNVPLLGPRCSTCGTAARPVAYSPPGDVRPAMQRDLEDIRRAIESGFAPAREPLRGRLVILNAISSQDGMEEIIIGGAVAGVLREREAFLPRADFAATMAPSKGIVEADPGARASLAASSNLMAPGALEASPEVREGGEVVVTVEGGVVAAGRARMGSTAMDGSGRGVAVKVRSRLEGVGYHELPATLDDAVAANVDELRRIEERAVGQVRRVSEDLALPDVVSFSGGKDSLATLLIALEAGLRPRLLFIDTGLELPGTREYIVRTAERHGLELTVAEAGDAFAAAMVHFGPPAKDYRWCCKTNKLGPTALAIRKAFPGGVLSFIGQRRYESQSRARSGARWDNPWVPGQRAFSPIQDWTALHVWLYLRWKGAEVNPWYEKGLERIGCSICPAADEAEGRLMAEHVDLSWWTDALTAYAESVGLPPEWVVRGLWRWRHPGEHDVEADPESHEARHADALRFGRREGHVTAQAGEHDLRLLPILDASDVRIERTGDGVVIEGRDRDQALNLIVRAHSCVACGICTARCPAGALTLENGGLAFDEGLCTRCKECLGPCPVVDFHPLRFRPRMLSRHRLTMEDRE
ncbi:MAG: phosphoadenosine phosphosulfate reductase family protein [Thermoplasmata archaeon]|nr:phosphoadenosine phosphosulfate reductase family protein [Thermoplasmata archaeon]